MFYAQMVYEVLSLVSAFFPDKAPVVFSVICVLVWRLV